MWYHDAEESLSRAGALQPCNIDIYDDIGLLLRSMPQSVVRNLPLKKKIFPLNLTLVFNFLADL